jgi:hypothetical protein
MPDVAKHWNAALYPEIEAAGGLPQALQPFLSALPSGLLATGFDPPSRSYATVNRKPRSCQLLIAATHRAFSVDFWHQGVALGHGSVSSLAEAARAIHAFLAELASAQTLRSSFPWVDIRPAAAVHEKGPRAFVEHAWQENVRWLEREPASSCMSRLLPLVRACMLRPRLRRLMPFTSHDRLCFSRTTGYPFTLECPPAFPMGQGTFRIEREGGGSFDGNAAEVAAALEECLADDCGAAAHGTAENGPSS